MSEKKSINKRIEEIVDGLTDSWWKDGGREAFIKHGIWLHELGAPLIKIRLELQRLHDAVAAEYGD